MTAPKLSPEQSASVADRLDAGEFVRDLAAEFKTDRNAIVRAYERVRGYPRKLASGGVLHRPSRLTVEQRAMLESGVLRGLSDWQMSRETGIHRSSVRRYLERRTRPGQPPPPEPAAPPPAPEPPPPRKPVFRQDLPAPDGAMSRLRARLAELRARAPVRAEAPAPPRPAARDVIVRGDRSGIPSNSASKCVTILENNGWRAESKLGEQGLSVVEVRDMRVRHHPLIATLRSEEQVIAFLEERGRGIGGGPAIIDYDRSRNNGPRSLTSPRKVGSARARNRVTDHHQSEDGGAWMRASIGDPTGRMTDPGGYF